MDRPTFVYVTYIATTREKLWEALTNGDFTAQYWCGSRIESDWQVGSPVHHVNGGQFELDGEVLAVDPPRRLSYTFHDYASEERPSRVVFELEPNGNAVKLTLTHDDFEPGSTMIQGISVGWPQILCSLKSLLEAGAALNYAHWPCD